MYSLVELALPEENQQILNQLSVEESQISEDRPGCPVFDPALYCCQFDECLQPTHCGFRVGGGRFIEKYLVSLQLGMTSSLISKHSLLVLGTYRLSLSGMFMWIIRPRNFTVDKESWEELKKLEDFVASFMEMTSSITSLCFSVHQTLSEKLSKLKGNKFLFMFRCFPFIKDPYWQTKIFLWELSSIHLTAHLIPCYCICSETTELNLWLEYSSEGCVASKWNWLHSAASMATSSQLKKF